MPHELIPFWHFNVALEERTTDCPDYLHNLSLKDVTTLSMWDADFEEISWERATQIIRKNQRSLTLQNSHTGEEC